MQDQHRGLIPTLRTARPYAVNLRQRRQWFDDNGESDGADTATPTDTQPAENGAGGSGDNGATFTQADIDRIAGERAKRAEEATLKKLLAELEVEDTSSLKAMLKAQKEREEAEKTELEKAQAKIDAAEKKAAEAEARAQSVEQARLEDRRNSAVIAALKDKGAMYPEDVLLYAQNKHTEALTAIVGEDGSVDSKAIDKLVGEIEKARPDYFKSGSPGSQSHAGGRTPRPDNKELVEQIKRGLRY